jgi:nitroimidazol reductase NimA-like FMN-containing flavoprotein (pyridoxamine 5'-phosphate oxidase superfamily)
MSFHMRRRDKEITNSRLLKTILKSVKYVTISMSMNNQSYLVSLSCGYDENCNCIYFHCAKEGKKLEYLKTNSNVWGQALLDYGYMQGECDHNFASVHFKGKVNFITDPKEKLHALEIMIRQLDKNPDALIVKINQERLKSTLIGRIDIDFMTGKKSKELTI